MKFERNSSGQWSFKHNRLRILRELHGLSPEDVGKRIGRPGMTIRNWEKGGSPRITDIVVIANEFQVDPRSFFTQEDTQDTLQAVS